MKKQYRELDEADRKLIRQTLVRTQNDRSRTCKITGCTRDAVNLVAAGKWPDGES